MPPFPGPTKTTLTWQGLMRLEPAFFFLRAFFRLLNPSSSRGLGFRVCAPHD